MDQDRSARVTVTPDGPYEVTGGLPLIRQEIVRSPAGESVEWRTTEEVDAPTNYRLCRCGRSQSKPFCDDSHLLEPRFDGTETADHTPTAERRRVFKTRELLVGDDVPLCASAAFCDAVDGDVWSFLRQSRDPEVRARIKHMIDRCPSGRLTYRDPSDAEDHEDEYEPTVSVVRDGPVRLLGGVEMIGTGGKPWETRNRVALCRCGRSENKPFCDGMHNVVGFRDPMDDDVSGDEQAGVADAGVAPARDA
jgi:CDGSH-type Zn-finger protein